MIFGKIEYLNLLPFHIFMKRYLRSSQEKAIMHYKKAVPSRINAKFIRRDVDAAFISSIKARKYASVNLGIVAKREVRSVLVLPLRSSKSDIESATSNILAKVLQQKGEVLIGDKALRYALKESDYVDLAALWHERYRLPFVFALLCYHKEQKRYKKIEKKFLQREYKIPHYLLTQASKKTDISTQEIQNYLSLISYKIDAKAKLGLKKFYAEAKRIS